ncbi:MAG TPA: OpgC domain-containing protein [Noviherbaspirillum sp.]|jgi:hypothetical protein|uniref:OpgC domain-containing protein n=1 Tax=Noviherbaspirillum sp. TaxID=1926288 RepID=UPI002F91EB75
MTRLWEIDMLRGLMLVLMFSTHLPTRFSSLLGQPFGYVSAAEGFVTLSAFMAGMVYASRGRRHGVPAMRAAFFARALKIYGCQAALLVFLFTVVTMLGLWRDQPALKNLIDFYLGNPQAGLWGSLLLIYNPPLLDILPLYVLLMLGSPLALAIGMHGGWRWIFAGSFLLWALAQTRLPEILYAYIAAPIGLQVPYHETGAFQTLAWQLLWVTGLWMGALAAEGRFQQRRPLPRPVLVAALAIALVFLLWRYAAGQAPAEPGTILYRLLDKWHLGPLRLLNFLALLVLLLHLPPRLKAAVPRVGFLEKLGAASLPVFCAHLVLVLLALSLVGESRPERPLRIDALLYFGGMGMLYLTALATIFIERKAAERGEPPPQPVAATGVEPTRHTR